MANKSTTVKYSLFSRRRGARFWNRRSRVALGKTQAARFFQDLLIGGAFDPDNEWELRRVTDEHNPPLATMQEVNRT